MRTSRQREVVGGGGVQVQEQGYPLELERACSV